MPSVAGQAPRLRPRQPFRQPAHLIDGGQACDFAILNHSPLLYFSMISDASLLVLALSRSFRRAASCRRLRADGLIPIISDSTFMLAPICSPIRISISLAMMAGALLLLPQSLLSICYTFFPLPKPVAQVRRHRAGNVSFLAPRFALPVSPMR